MNCKFIKYFFIAMVLTFPAAAAAQEGPKSKEEIEKELYEKLQEKVENLQESLKLEDWQTFYVDSIYTHDCFAMHNELSDLQKKGVANVDIYINVQDKWEENIYNAVHRVLSEEQWAKYLKEGEGKAKKARDKRAGKKQGKK